MDYQNLLRLSGEHEAIINTRSAGYALPQQSLEWLLGILDGRPANTFTDPVRAAALLPELGRHCPVAAMRAYCLAYVGGASAAMFEPSRADFWSVASPEEIRAAVLLAGMRGPDLPRNISAAENALVASQGIDGTVLAA